MAEYRLDVLARVAGAEVRGRVGWYDHTHLEPLRLIARLHRAGPDRGR